MASAEPSSSRISRDARKSQATSTISYFDYDSSISGDENRLDRTSSSGKNKASEKPRWLTHVKDWLSVNEPSAQAMKTQKRNIYQKHGIDLKDPAAAAKLHFPMGQMPAGATTSTTGPGPEKALKKRAKERQMGQSYAGYTHTSHSRSMSSGISSTPSTKYVNPITPWNS